MSLELGYHYTLVFAYIVYQRLLIYKNSKNNMGYYIIFAISAAGNPLALLARLLNCWQHSSTSGNTPALLVTLRHMLATLEYVMHMHCRHIPY